MPAAAVIPAPIVYIKAVAVKKLVVGIQGLEIMWRGGRCEGGRVLGGWLRLVAVARLLFACCRRHVGPSSKKGRVDGFRPFIHRSLLVK